MSIVEPYLNKIYCCHFDFGSPYTDWWSIYPPSNGGENDNFTPFPIGKKWPNMFPETHPPFDPTKWPIPKVTEKPTDGYQEIKKALDRVSVYGYEWKEEIKGYYSVNLEVPGFKKENITIELKDRVLTLKASRVDKKYSDRVRTLTLPKDADENNIAAKVEDGILTVTVAKIVPPQPKKILVN